MVIMLKNVMDLKEREKNTGEKISNVLWASQMDYLNKEDLENALKIFNLANQKEPLQKSDLYLSVASVFEIIRSVLHNNKHITSSEIVDKLDIRDPKIIDEIHKQYHIALKELNQMQIRDPMEQSVYVWAKIGHILFFGIVSVLLIAILIKITRLYKKHKSTKTNTKSNTTNNKKYKNKKH